MLPAQQELQMHERLLRDFPPNVVFSDGLVSAANLAIEYGAALQAAGRWEQALPVLREGAAYWQLQAEAAPGDITAGRSRGRSALCRLNEARAQRALRDSQQALAAVQAGIVVLAPAAADPRQGAETRLAQAELHLLRAELGVLVLQTLAPDQRQLAQQLARPAT